MKIYNRIFGDPPSGGYANSMISSIGFPGGAKWADTMDGTRLPLTKESEVREDDFNVYYEAYEYQSLTYGQPAVIRSMVATKATSGAATRPHGFTHIAAPESNDGELWVTDTVDPAQLLTYDAFITMQAFWEITANISTYPVADWQPPEMRSLPWKSPITPPQDMMDALLLRYWKTLSARAFSDSLTIQPVEILLSDVSDKRAMITQAKAFFGTQMIPKLPKATHNILSMSVPVQQKYIQSFNPTALVFLTPEKIPQHNENLFDFRNNSYVPLDAWHAAFIQRILHNELSPGTQYALETYLKHTHGKYPAHCSFMADYQVIYGFESIENKRIDIKQTPAELLSIWRGLLMRLNKYHQIEPMLCQRMIKPIIQSALQQLNGLDAALPINKEQLSFLFSAALVANDSQEYQNIMRLITRHQTEVAEPFFLLSLPWEALPGNASSVAGMMRTILEECYVNAAPNASVLQTLCLEKLHDACTKNPELHMVMNHYIQTLSRKHPENSIDLLPLANLYSDPSDILYNTVNILITQYVETAPDSQICRNLKQLLATSGKHEILDMLDQYFDLLFWKQRKQSDVLLQTAGEIGIDMTNAVLRILDTAASSHTPEALPLTKSDLNLLTDGLQRQINRPQDIRKALVRYIEKAIHALSQTGFDWFSWLTDLNNLKNWLPEDTIIQFGIEYMPAWIQQHGLPDSRHFQLLLSWLQSGYHTIFLQVENHYLKAYDVLAESGDSQLLKLIPWFRDVSKAHYVRTYYLQWLQKHAVNVWEQDLIQTPNAPTPSGNPQQEAEAKYWDGTAKLRLYLAVCGFPSEQLFNDRVRFAAEALLHQIFQSQNLHTLEYERIFQSRSQQPNDAFKQIWHQELVHAYTQHYSAVLSNPLKSLQELCDLEAIKTNIQADHELLNSPQERYCQDVLLAASFCTRLNNVNALISETNNTIRRLSQHLSDQKNHHPLQALYRYCTQPDMYQRFRFYHIQARLSVGLICTFWMSDGLSIRNLMNILMSSETAVPIRPYDVDNLPFLQTIVWLFSALAIFNVDYPMQLVKALQADSEYVEYTNRLRSNKHLFYHYFPKYSPSNMTAEWQLHTPLNLWLNP